MRRRALPRGPRAAKLYRPLATCVLTFAVRAGAEPASQEPEEPIVLAYMAEGDCPSTAEFIQGVRSYTTNWRIVPEGTPHARTINVRIEATEAEARGTLTTEEPKERPSTRTLVGPSCVAVSEALAVMVAVAIDPHANDVIAPPPTTAPPPLRSPARHRPPVSQVPAVEPSRTRVALDVRGEVTSAVVGEALFGVGLGVAIEPSFASTGGWRGPFRPSIGIGVRQTFPRSTVLRGGSVTFLWTAAGLRLCPVRFPLVGARIEISACAETNLGALQAQAHEFADARNVTLFWADIGGSTWIKAALTRRWFVDATFLAVAPLERRSVELRSGAVAARSPAFGVLGGIGVGTHF